MIKRKKVVSTFWFNFASLLLLTSLPNAVLNQKVGTTFADEIEKDVPSLCSGLEKAFEKRNWGKNPCRGVEWKVGGTSVKGRPLIYVEFGPADSKNTTLVFSMVHGNEITPLYLGFEMVGWAMEHMKKYPKSRLVIAPLVNPDGFFEFPKTRTNTHGVDCNRNFNTKDWKKDALAAWKKKFNSESSRFPGHEPDSEPETQFQKSLIDKIMPNKVLSIHSPLNVIDYDGPDRVALNVFSVDYVKKCQELRNRVKAIRTGFFPGSLGNYAGQELGIPTITLELPTALAPKAKEYWNKFKTGIETVVTYEVPPKVKK